MKGLLSLLLALFGAFPWLSSNASRSSPYDLSINWFSDQGELAQVDYARKAATKEGLPIVCGISQDNEVILCSRIINIRHRLLDRKSVDKITRVYDHIFLASSGLAGDARALLEKARIFCINHQHKFGSRPSVYSVARYIGEIQHEATLGGVENAVIGFNEETEKAEIYHTDPSGSVDRYTGLCIGKNKDRLMQLLEAGYSNDLSSSHLQDLLVKICADGSEEEEIERSKTFDMYRIYWDGKRLVSRHKDNVDGDDVLSPLF